MTVATLPTAPPRALEAPAPPPAPAPIGRAGLVYGLAAYLAWGLAPMYFKQIAHVAPLRVVSHRIIWSVVFLAVILAVGRKWGEVRAALRSRRTLWMLGLSAALIAGNWLMFIWAITAGHLLQASLGYFINPLVNVLLGMVFLRERLRVGQAVGVALATLGVLTLALSGGQFPWLALSLAVTFALYGLLRKTAHVGALVGLSVETALLLPLAVLFVAGPWGHAGNAAASDPKTMTLLALAGPVTVFPLLCFAAAARRLRLATLGFLQYVSPTCHFLLAVFLYREAFSRESLISFSFIWAALLVYSAESVRFYRRRARAAEAEAADAQCQCPDFT